MYKRYIQQHGRFGCNTEVIMGYVTYLRLQYHRYISRYVL